MLKSVIIAIAIVSSFTLTSRVEAYPRALEILLEGIDDPSERARRIRIYQKPISTEDKKLVNDAKAKAEAERNRRTNKGKSNKKGKGKKGKKGKKKR